MQMCWRAGMACIGCASVVLLCTYSASRCPRCRILGGKVLFVQSARIELPVKRLGAQLHATALTNA